MQTANFDEILARIVAQDARYDRQAYIFVREALEHTQEARNQKRKSSIAHVTGQELLEGIRQYALTRYGPMAMTLLHEWGVHRCEDFGEIVFLMVDHSLLGKTEKDSRDDFKGGYNFYDAFRKPFLPPSHLQSSPSVSVSPAPQSNPANG